jgi:ankyrin repeat protein
MAARRAASSTRAEAERLCRLVEVVLPLTQLASQVSDTAGEVFTYDLESCVRPCGALNPSPKGRVLTGLPTPCQVRNDDDAGTEKWGRLCASRGLLDTRTGTHLRCRHGCFRATPLAFAAYTGDFDVAAALLPATADLDAKVSELCEGKLHCKRLLTPLQLAVSRGGRPCVQTLLMLRADASLQTCWPLEAVDEADFDEVANAMVSPVLGLTALGLAAARGHAEVCRLLLSHGARVDDGDAATSTLAPLVAPLLDADGAARECPVCLEVMFEAAAYLTTTCGHTFHRRCLAPSVSRCPMCRSDLTAEDAHKLGRSLHSTTLYGLTP